VSQGTGIFLWSGLDRFDWAAIATEEMAFIQQAAK